MYIYTVLDVPFATTEPLKDNYFCICDHLIRYELKNQSHANATSQNNDYTAMV